MLNLKELRSRAKLQGVRGYSKMKKQELIDLLSIESDGQVESVTYTTDVNEDDTESVSKPITKTSPQKKNIPYGNMTNRALMNEARSRGLKNYSKMNKQSLVELLDS